MLKENSGKKIKKEITVVINVEEKEVEKRDYSFQEIIVLAYGSFDDSQKSYTMITTLNKDKSEKHSREYSFGDEIKMKEGMRINVDSTNRS